MLTFNLAGGGLEELFGVGVGAESRDRVRVTWAKPRGIPEEDQLPISHAGEAQLGSVGYTATTAETLASFDDGSAAVACRAAGGGQACVMGVDLGDLAERAMNLQAAPLARVHVNGFEPTVDVLVEWVRDLYIAGEPMPWLVSSAPSGKDVSILLTHDVVSTPSAKNSRAYVDALNQVGAKATFFVQTKYVKDFNDDVFFTDAALPDLKDLVAQGMEIESHGVSHSHAFKSFLLGSGKEHYPRYRPFARDEDKAKNGTVLGEVRVSRYLLETLVGAKVRAFRPGYLVSPVGLPRALAATGYAYSSSIMTNSVLTHLPYQLNDDRAGGALTPIYEFPVTIEDEAAPPLPERLASAQALIANIARHRGIAVILIHPDTVEPKLSFETSIVEAWRDKAWIGPIADFGDWWRARDQAEIDVDQQDGKWQITAGGDAAVHDVEVLLPKAAATTYRVERAAGQRTAESISAP